ncbi:hypothetical protein FHP25_32655 [Vineibacter terrae]|uniref:DUF4258 domain-containing protein n=1 Tax=Vineibacter terrae TaxID=2586908 RepID=A0A5C8PC74_9HYPH|nr:hypothetical protein [Vineibacter terrae]TXL70857.1 hypothetical protein FHP25_32575 [Vineibacter terrae]TXL70872.1 hypothetical protein FHP25_32655 [Vineibacter terrae]
MKYTAHGAARCRQRGIQQEVVDVLLDYGRQGRHLGAEVIFMNKKARLHARRELGERMFARIADRLDAYLVVSDDGAIITGAQRLKRLKF